MRVVDRFWQENLLTYFPSKINNYKILWLFEADKKFVIFILTERKSSTTVSGIWVNERVTRKLCCYDSHGKIIFYTLTVYPKRTLLTNM